MIIERKENWGMIRYDTCKHQFRFSYKNNSDVTHYIREPLVLNLDLTMKCNMACRHCVAKDFKNTGDLDVSPELIEYINNSPFMVIVITGGEPLLYECENRLLTLIEEIKSKGLIIDTNGTITPSNILIHQIMENDVLIRVSLDSVRPQDETYFRQMKKYGGKGSNTKYLSYYKKLETIKYLKEKGANVSIQSVIHKKNIHSIEKNPSDMISFLRSMGINKWYIQRFIPSYKMTDKRHDISTSKYEDVIKMLDIRCKEAGIEFIAKKDKRHNSVFLLVGEGLLYTQSEKPGEKIEIGHYRDHIDYFGIVSLPDHQDRYYI